MCGLLRSSFSLFGFRGRLDVYKYVWNHLSPSGNNRLGLVLVLVFGLLGIWLLGLAMPFGVVGLLGWLSPLGVLSISVGAVGCCCCSSR